MSETYTASAELKEDVDIISILKKCVEMNNMFVGKASVDGNLLWHLQKNQWNLLTFVSLLIHLISNHISQWLTGNIAFSIKYRSKDT